jgi:glycosyltransferase involved in cell wall biosynthesis
MLLQGNMDDRNRVGMMIKRIVTIHDFCDPNGGATLLAVASARGFRERGYEVTFLTGDEGRNLSLTDAGVNIVSLGDTPLRQSSKAGLVLKGLYNLRARDFVRNWIETNDQPDTIYHLHNWAQILSPAVLSALGAVRERLFLSAHDFFHVCPNGSFSFLRTGELCPHKPMTIDCVRSNCDRQSYALKLARVARQAIRNHVFDTSAQVPVIAIHERMKPLFVRAGVREQWVKVLPNPVEPFFAERIPAEQNDELVFIGRIEHTKGPDLIAAAARRAGVKMRFIGAGAMLSRLQRDYPEAIFDEFVPRHRLPEKLKNARAVAMPSRYAEPYGLVAVEALWSGLPIIIADTAFLAHDVVAAGAGISCRAQDPEALTAAIETIFGSDQMTHEMSLAAFHSTRQLGNTHEGWIDALLDLFEQRLAGTWPIKLADRASMAVP